MTRKNVPEKAVKSYVAYYRVSTARQGASGLGLEAQQNAVRQFLGQEPDHEFIETESGRKKNRPQLVRALESCANDKCTLIIAKLDRLSRDATFLLSLRDSNVDFICCDVPNADRLTIGILALVAEREAELISQRTRDALQAAKRRGIRLGNPRLARARMAASAARRKQALDFALKMKPFLAKSRRQGVNSNRDLALALNAKGHRGANGKPFHHQTVANLLKRLANHD